jgi:hypothetical protein
MTDILGSNVSTIPRTGQRKMTPPLRTGQHKITPENILAVYN